MERWWTIRDVIMTDTDNNPPWKVTKRVEILLLYMAAWMMKLICLRCVYMYFPHHEKKAIRSKRSRCRMNVQPKGTLWRSQERWEYQICWDVIMTYACCLCMGAYAWHSPLLMTCVSRVKDQGGYQPCRCPVEKTSLYGYSVCMPGGFVKKQLHM